MAANEKALQIELDKIKNTGFDVRGHFKLLFANLLADKQQQHERVALVEQLIDENTLDVQLHQEYPGKDYVLLFYAHEPHSPALHPDPQFRNDPRAHTSLLLGKVHEGKIAQLLNIDGYNHLNYADPSRSPYIKQRLVIQAQGSADREALTPLQRASWQNMNCVLYSFTFAKQILALFQQQPELMINLFPEQATEKVSAENLFLLHEGILAGMSDKYVRAVGPHYIYDQAFNKEYNKRMRETLATSYALQFSQAQPTAVENSPAHQHPAQETSAETFAPKEPVSPVQSRQDPEKPKATSQDANNYNFLLNVGIVFSASLAIAAFVVGALALAAVVMMPPLAIPAVIAVGAISGLVSYSLFATKAEEPLDNTATSSKQPGR